MWLEILLHLGLAVVAYAVLTTGLWQLVHRREKPIGLPAKLAIGLVYGGCTVAANHFGIDYGTLVLNVRDIGPLAAGLFFSPISGIIAGAIGGIERIVAGEVYDIGRFSALACGMSTFLAGILAAILNKKVYKGRPVPATQAFFLGAVTEVFHMYAILFTNRDSLSYAYSVVKTASLPMVVFTAAGMVVCSVIILKISGNPLGATWKTPEEKLPLAILFQRALLAVIAGLFLFNFIVSFNFQTRLVTENATMQLEYLGYEKKYIYESSQELERLQRHLEEQTTGEVAYWLLDSEGGVLALDSEEILMTIEPSDMEQIIRHADEGPYRTKLASLPGMDLLCNACRIGTDHYLLILQDADAVYDARNSQMYEKTLSDILFFTVLYMLIAMLAERLVVQNLKRINTSLERITKGHLDEPVWVHTSSEFTALSEDINKTVSALRGYIDAAEQKMKDELAMAALIQDSALPKTFTLPSKNIELYALMVPAKEVGGDFYDFFYIDLGKLCIVIADVSGKGVPAALFMMRAKTNIKNQARAGSSPKEILAKVNNALCEGNTTDIFVTVWLGILDLRTGQMQCANAGHEYPALMRAGGRYELVKDPHGLVLAAMENTPIREYEIRMNPGDRLFIYTDGVPEAINEKNEAYGTERMISRLSRLRNISQERTLEGVLQDIRNFAGNAEQFDDITMLGLSYLGNQPGDGQADPEELPAANEKETNK